MNQVSRAGCAALADGMVVVAFRASTHEFGRRQFSGAFRFARQAGWDVMTVEYGTKTTSRFPAFEVKTARDVRRVLEFLHPAGCLVESDNTDHPIAPEVFDGYPTVFLDRHPETVGKRHSCVFSDAGEIAADAARELASLGLANYACLSYPGHEIWSRERAKAFENAVKRFAGSYSSFGHQGLRIRDVSDLRVKTGKWIETLPKPCGLFVVNDYLAEIALSAAKERGVSVPEDLAIVGVDDDEQICEAAVPTLSSIRQDFERGGYLAAELLSRLMDNRRLKGLRTSFGVSRVVRRASTRRFRGMDARVATALEFIRLHACEGVEPPAVVSAMGCSRRLADLRFREALGHTILDEIHAVRLTRVKELLLDPSHDLASVPDFCGYASMDDLRRVFRRHFGMTLRQFAKQKNGLP